MQDCLELLNNLLRTNAGNQLMFRCACMPRGGLISDGMRAPDMRAAAPGRLGMSAPWWRCCMSRRRARRAAAEWRARQLPTCSPRWRPYTCC